MVKRSTVLLFRVGVSIVEKIRHGKTEQEISGLQRQSCSEVQTGFSCGVLCWGPLPAGKTEKRILLFEANTLLGVSKPFFVVFFMGGPIPGKKKKTGPQKKTPNEKP